MKIFSLLGQSQMHRDESVVACCVAWQAVPAKQRRVSRGTQCRPCKVTDSDDTGPIEELIQHTIPTRLPFPQGRGLRAMR